ncbi:LytTR family transcriptional regulator DNA-binding domain-containing protein [Paenibacillus sp. FSL R5-0475]|uniref:LytTR family transcriptional regulator DNA-binding domain-containing protein n=1 Tax=Paenibacillus sp. FSL R5-0475 TaxID=2921643 RepID=UPI0030F58302
MGILTVTRDVDAVTGVISLPIRDIAFLEYASQIDRVIVHTINEMFYMPGTLKYWQSALDSSGYNFASVDRTNVVNLDKIVLVDEIYRVAYFESSITKTTKKCTFTIINFDKFQKKYEQFSKSTSALATT